MGTIFKKTTRAGELVVLLFISIMFCISAASVVYADTDEITACAGGTVSQSYETTASQVLYVESSDESVATATYANTGISISNVVSYLFEVKVTGVSLGTATITVWGNGVNLGYINVVVKDHEWESDYTVDIYPDCLNEGIESIHCKNCTSTKESRTIDKLDHTWNVGEVIQEPTCTEKGVKEFYCTLGCGTTKTEDIPAKGHNWESSYTIDKEPTCTKDGSKSIHCKVCEETKNVQTIPAAHTWESEYTIDIKPTCVKDGSKSIHCKKCSSTKSTKKVSALGHHFVNKVDKAKVGIEGKQYDMCTRCGTKANIITIPALNPNATKIKKITKIKKGLKVKWARKKYSGYEIRYSLKSNMKRAKTILVKKAKTTSKKITKLKSKRKYYIQIRTFKTVKGKKYYSDWSKRKAVKTK